MPEGLIQATKSGLAFTRPPTKEEWLEIGKYISTCRRASLRWVADWRATGREAFGVDAVAEAEAQLQFEFKDLRLATSLEEMPQRNPELTDEHHFVVAKASLEPDSQKYWLEAAAENHLTPKQLKHSIEFGKVTKDAPGINPQDKSTGFISIEGIAGQFGMWLRKVRKDGFPGQWDAERISRVREMLQPIVDVHNEISKD
jgi:hypothetical protein